MPQPRRRRAVIALTTALALGLAVAVLRTGGGDGGPLSLAADPSVLPSPSMSPPSPYPSPVVSGPGAQAVNCATIGIHASGLLPTDTPGDLVPYGATSATRCETALDPGPDTVVADPQVLTTGVDSLVEVLNALPAAPVGQGCLRVGFPTQISLVFTFDAAVRPAPLVVTVDRNCSALVTADKARSYTIFDPMPIFDKLWAAQPGPGARPGPRRR